MIYTFLDFWRYPMSFSHPLSSESHPPSGASEKHHTELQNDNVVDSSFSESQVTEPLENGNVFGPKPYSRLNQIHFSNYNTKFEAKRVSTLLDDTIVGLEEVGNLLQASLREIENERSSLDIPTSSKVRPLSRVLQESKEFLYTTDRGNSKESLSNQFGSNGNIGKNDKIVVEDT